MQTLEFTAKSVQEATHTAAQKLNVTPDRVRVTVLEETKGLFGKSWVRVRVEVAGEAAPAAAPTPPPSPTPQETLNDVQAAVDAPAKPERKPRAPRRGKKEDAPEAATGPVAATEPAPAASAPATEAPASDEELVASADDAEAVANLVRELLAAANVEVTAKVGGMAGKYVNIVLDGRDVAFIVGKHGEVLNALQYLVNIVIGRRLDRQVRATLDGNDYRRRREEALTQLATKIAAQVKQRGEEAVLDALPAFERRIVHKALSEIEGISTYSEGEEPNRRVVIAPAD